MEEPLVKALEELEFITEYSAGLNGAVERGSDYINSTVTGYDQAVLTFADGKSFFIKQGNWIYSNVAAVDAEKAANLTFLPVKMNFEAFDITASGMTVEKMNASIPEFVSQSYVINKKATYEQKAEVPGVSIEEIGQYIGNDGVFSMNFDFSYTDLDLEAGELWLKKRSWSVNELRTALFTHQLNVQQNGWAANYLENHDQPRSISKYFAREQIERYHAEMAKALATWFMLLRGTPFIYQGQELGLLNTEYESISELDDVNSVGQYNRCLEEGYSKEQAMESINQRSRDHARYPMQWDDTAYFGFSDKSPWLPCGKVSSQLTVEKQKNSPDSVLNYYRKLIWLRNKSGYSEILTFGTFLPDESLPDSVISYRRLYQGRTVHVTVNMTGQNIEAQQLISSNRKILLCNYSESGTEAVLRPYEAVVWEENF